MVVQIQFTPTTNYNAFKLYPHDNFEDTIWNVLLITYSTESFICSHRRRYLFKIGGLLEIKVVCIIIILCINRIAASLAPSSNVYMKHMLLSHFVFHLYIYYQLGYGIIHNMVWISSWMYSCKQYHKFGTCWHRY